MNNGINKIKKIQLIRYYFVSLQLKQKYNDMVLTENRVKELLKEDFRQLIETNKDIFFNLFQEYFVEMIEDKGMFNAIREISEEDNQEVDKSELDAIFNGEFTN